MALHAIQPTSNSIERSEAFVGGADRFGPGIGQFRYGLYEKAQSLFPDLCSCIHANSSEVEAVVHFCPTGKSLRPLIWCRLVPFSKIFPSPPDPNHFYIPAVPSHTEGRFAIVTDVGNGMWWTRQHG